MQLNKILLVAKNPGYLRFALKHKIRSFAWGNVDYYLGNGFSLSPITLSINLTQRCELNCRMCLQYKKANTQTNQMLLRYPREEEMDWPVLKRVIDQAPGIHCLVYLTGGEPFLHPEIIKVAHYAKQKKIYLSIVTNGHSLNTHCQDLVKIGVDNITVSLHGPEAVHDQIVGQSGAFRTATNGIRDLIELRDRWRKTRPLIKINHVILPENIDKMPEMVALSNKLGVDTLRFQHPIFEDPQIVQDNIKVVPQVLGYDNLSPHFTSYRDRGEYFFLPITPGQIDQLQEIIAEIDNKKHMTRVVFSPHIRQKDLHAYYLDLKHPFYNRCFWPWDTLTVKPNGDVEACFHYRIGNVKKARLVDLWNAAKMQRFRNALKKVGLFPSCIRCCYRNYYSESA